MVHFFSRFFRLIITAAIFLLVIFCLCFAVMQTKWAKEKMQAFLVEQCEKEGMVVHIEGLNGRLPFSWTIDRVELETKAHQTILLNQVKVRLAIFPLLRKHISINYLSISQAGFSFLATKKSSDTNYEIERIKHLFQNRIESFSPGFHISVDNLKIGRLTITNRGNNHSYTFSLSARGKWRRDNREFFFNGKFSVPETAQVYAEIYLNGNKSKGEINAGIKAHIEELRDLASIYQFPFDGDILVEATLTGSWKAWEALLWDKPIVKEQLTGSLKGRLRNLKVPEYPLLNRTWGMRSQFSLQKGAPLQIEQLQLISNLIRIKGNGVIGEDLQTSAANIEFTLPKLARFSSIFEKELKGKIKGTAIYGNGNLECSFVSDAIDIDSYTWQGISGEIKAHQEDVWRGDAQLAAMQGTLPFQSKMKLTWDPSHILQLSEISLTTDEGVASGDLNIAFPSYLINGGLNAQISQIRRFKPFFNNQDLKGSVEAECKFWSEQKNSRDEQNVRIEMTSKNFHYADYSIINLSLIGEVYNLYDTPYGGVDLLASQIYTPRLFLNQLKLTTFSDGGQWPFSLNASGSMQDPFQLLINGNWEKQGERYSLELLQADGEISKQKIHLQNTCAIVWGPNQFQISPCEFKIGEGTLQTSLNLGNNSSSARIEAKRFPLGVLAILRPTYSLEGTVNASGFLEANQDKISGALNAVLEQAELLYSGKDEPLKAKGTLQLHLDNRMLQAHSIFHASGDQFLDFSASVPVQYSSYPFHLSLDETKPMSGEITGEGRLEEIFDFINIGAHQVGGFIACKLLFSQTLASPAVQGMIDWENGYYENYYTGTMLKDVQAHIDAEKDQLKLTSLHAHDENGTVFATGSLQLKPQQKFPYELSAELNNLNALRFDMVDGNLTGPLYITGNTSFALAQGNLTVPKARIKIPDQLPYEIPSLPITFINSPEHLAVPPRSSSSGFPFHIDVELTAENEVLVEGKGLTSEWQGSVHLTGTNMNIAASGKLELIKGEYYFTGKIFKLSEGEIVFNDKPTPSAYLKINGILSLQDVEIIANLRGPLSSPQLTFQSNPHLTTSAILARILFNKDIGDISQPEALQLATTLVDLSSGATPSIMETIRKTLGIDRLTIAPSSNSDELALQIGKYLTKGVLITLSQSATSTQVIVEVELKKGFVFQAETQEEQEGKFSLKWRHNY